MCLGKPIKIGQLELFGESEVAMSSGNIQCKIDCASLSSEGLGDSVLVDVHEGLQT